MAGIREFERFSTTALNAYLQPEVSGYLGRLETALKGKGFAGEFLIVQSNGGVMAVDTAYRLPIRTALSGPAAGVIAAAYIAKTAGFSDVITGDMGGTSFDVALIADGQATLMIASSDRDFSYLAEQLRELGKQVVGIGKETAPISFRAACTQFLQLPLAKAQSTNPSARVPATKAIPVIRGILAQSNRPGNWGTMSWIGHCLRQSKPPFEPADYGHISIEAFVRSLNFFEFGQSATGETQVRDPKPNVLGDAPHAP